MKGIILAGGTGTRLHPLTQVTNKHLLPVGMKPMIMWPLAKLIEGGIRKIMVICGPEHSGDFMALLGSGRKLGCELTYRIQDEAGGIAQALMLCDDFVGRDRFCVLLGDNIFSDPLLPFVQSYDALPDDHAMILVKEVEDPRRYGVVEVSEDRVVAIEEKPREPRSNLAQTGIYFYPPHAFSLLPRLQPSNRGELEVTDLNMEFVREGKLRIACLDGEWTDAGTPESYVTANRIVSCTQESPHTE